MAKKMAASQKPPPTGAEWVKIEALLDEIRDAIVEASLNPPLDDETWTADRSAIYYSKLHRLKLKYHDLRKKLDGKD